MHGYVERRVADVLVDGRPVVVRVRTRRMRCSTLGCSRQTFREPLTVAGRYQRRTGRLATQVGHAVRELAGRAGARALAGLGVGLSRHTALRTLLPLPIPDRPVPTVTGVDDVALCKRQRYATVITDAVTVDRVDVLPDRRAVTLEAWLRDHPGVQVVCRHGSGAYAEAIRRALPDAMQVADRWHLWHMRREALVDRVETSDVVRKSSGGCGQGTECGAAAEFGDSCLRRSCGGGGHDCFVLDWGQSA